MSENRGIRLRNRGTGQYTKNRGSPGEIGGYGRSDLYNRFSFTKGNFLSHPLQSF